MINLQWTYSSKCIRIVLKIWDRPRWNVPALLIRISYFILFSSNKNYLSSAKYSREKLKCHCQKCPIASVQFVDHSNGDEREGGHSQDPAHPLGPPRVHIGVVELQRVVLQQREHKGSLSKICCFVLISSHFILIAYGIVSNCNCEIISINVSKIMIKMDLT